MSRQTTAVATATKLVAVMWLVIANSKVPTSKKRSYFQRCVVMMLLARSRRALIVLQTNIRINLTQDCAPIVIGRALNLIVGLRCFPIMFELNRQIASG